MYRYRLLVSSAREYSVGLVSIAAQAEVVSVTVLEKDCFGVYIGEGLLWGLCS